MSEKAKFSISVGDDDIHDDLTAEIYFENRMIALITQDAGLENAKLKIFCTNAHEECLCFELADFVEALQKAKTRLFELRRIQS